MATPAETVSDARAPEVRRRLKEARGDTSLRETEGRVREAAESLGLTGFRVDHTDVYRYEGSDSRRRPNPPTDYVRAFAEAFDLPVEHLLAEDVPNFTPDELEQEWKSLRARWDAQLPSEPATEQDQERDLLRDRVALALRTASMLPFSPNDARFEQLPRDTLAWIQDDLQRLFWEAFDGRGLTEAQLLERAVELGGSIPSPPRLPTEGFLRYAEIPERALERWWLHMAAALRELLRENLAYSPNRWNLGLYGEGGYPVPWDEWLPRWDRQEVYKPEEILRKVQDWKPSEPATHLPEDSGGDSGEALALPHDDHPEQE